MMLCPGVAALPALHSSITTCAVKGPKIPGSCCRSWCLNAGITCARASVQFFPKVCLAALAANSLPPCSATSAGPGCPRSRQHSVNGLNRTEAWLWTSKAGT